MATAEASPGTLGPRYAPDDPTLPEPWKGLIDGSTGLLYYWNPETNVTQYEKPTSLPPPLPPGPPPTASTPKMNPIPAARALQAENVQNPQFPHGQLSNSSLQTQVASQAAQQQVTPPGQLQGSHLGPAVQQGHLATEQMRPPMVQQPGQQVPSQLQGQLGLPQSMQQMSMLPGHQAPYQQPMPHAHQGQMYPGAAMGAPHGFQFTHQHTQYMAHQQNMPLQGPSSSSEQSQHLIQGQQLPHKQEHRIELGQRDDPDFHQAKQPGFSPAHQHLMQGQQYAHFREQKPGITQRDDVEFQQVNQAGFSPAQIQQTGTSSAQNLPMGGNSSHAQKMQQYSGSSAKMQQNNSSAHVQQTGTELTYPRHGPRFQNEMGPEGVPGQQQNLPPIGSKMPYEENHLGRPGNEYFYSTSKDANSVPHQLPKLAPLPTARNQQELRSGDFPSQNAAPNLPGRLNVGPPVPGGYTHPSGPGAPQYPSNAFVRPPLAMMGPSDPTNLSAAEIYRQKHEVTATGEDVPAPFMTFESTGFPPELLQEVRYLLQWRSTCRTLQCYAHIYSTTILSFLGCKMDCWSLRIALLLEGCFIHLTLYVTGASS